MPDYLIVTKIVTPGESVKISSTERLVRASNKARAIQHVVADTLIVEPATIDDAMRVAFAGGKLEVASDE